MPKRKFESKETAARAIVRAWRRGRTRQAFSKMKLRRRRQPLALKKHQFCERSTIVNSLTVAPDATAVGMIKEFSLNEIAQSGSYIDLFEEYQINKVVATFRYKSGVYAYDTTNPIALPNEICPILYFKVDHNDEVLESLADLKKSTKCREYQFTNAKPNFDVVLKPACLVDVSNIHGALGVAHRPKWKTWLPMDESAVSHYGLKAYAVGYSNAVHTGGQIDVTYKIYFSAKNNE